ncbi:MAG TPA: AtpZ/AtpI family protein [Flavobacteriales bacterium]|nr:AtpZ/AtpI family protein [Flavobacteriales bacterium]
MKDYVKYTGIGLQMFVIILLGSWGGKELNDYLGYKQPVITATAALLSIFLAMYYVFRQVRK